MNKLLELAELAGISSSYIDKVGEVHYTSDEVRRFFLNAMGFGVDNNEQIEQSLTKIKDHHLFNTGYSSNQQSRQDLGLWN